MAWICSNNLGMCPYFLCCFISFLFFCVSSCALMTFSSPVGRGGTVLRNFDFWVYFKKRAHWFPFEFWFENNDLTIDWE